MKVSRIDASYRGNGLFTIKLDGQTIATLWTPQFINKETKSLHNDYVLAAKIQKIIVGALKRSFSRKPY